MIEVWRPVIGFEGYYEVSNAGAVRALEREGRHKGRWGGLVLMVVPAHVMRISDSANGYKYLKLRRPGETPIHCLVHRLVMAAHVGEPLEGQQVNHKDGDKTNNNVENLEYCTPLENLRHCIDVLGKKRGEGAASKVTEDDVRRIRTDGRQLRVIAAEYGVTPQAIWMIRKRKNWAHVA